MSHGFVDICSFDDDSTGASYNTKNNIPQVAFTDQLIAVGSANLLKTTMLTDSHGSMDTCRFLSGDSVSSNIRSTIP